MPFTRQAMPVKAREKTVCEKSASLEEFQENIRHKISSIL
jgi:hypothetical protein